MVLLGGRVWFDPLIKVQAFGLAVIEEASVVTNWGIKPDIEVLTWRIRNLKPKIRGVAGNIPVAQLTFAWLANPLFHLITGFRLQRRFDLGPLAQESFATRIRQLEEVMIRDFFDWCCTAHN